MIVTVNHEGNQREEKPMIRGIWSAVVAAFVVSTAVAVTPDALPAQEDGKVRIAVVDFGNNSTWNHWGPRLGEAAANELATQLVQSGDFSVIERSRLEAIMAEQRLGQSGAVDASTAAEVGKLLGVQAIVTGAVTSFSIDQTGGGIGPFQASFGEAESQLDVRLVNTTTGEIMMAVESSGKEGFGGARFEDVNFQRSYDAGIAQKALRPAVQEAVTRISEMKSQLAAIEPEAPPGEVVGTGDNGVYIDRGENFDVETGQRFDVYRVVDEIRSSDGELLDTVTEKVGVIEVTRVLSQSSVCRVVSGDAGEGDEIRPQGGG